MAQYTLVGTVPVKTTVQSSQHKDGPTYEEWEEAAYMFWADLSSEDATFGRVVTVADVRAKSGFQKMGNCFVWNCIRVHSGGPVVMQVPVQLTLWALSARFQGIDRWDNDLCALVHLLRLLETSRVCPMAAATASHVALALYHWVPATPADAGKLRAFVATLSAAQRTLLSQAAHTVQLAEHVQPHTLEGIRAVRQAMNSKHEDDAHDDVNEYTKGPENVQ